MQAVCPRTVLTVLFLGWEFYTVHSYNQIAFIRFQNNPTATRLHVVTSLEQVSLIVTYHITIYFDRDNVLNNFGPRKIFIDLGV